MDLLLQVFGKDLTINDLSFKQQIFKKEETQNVQTVNTIKNTDKKNDTYVAPKVTYRGRTLILQPFI